MSSKIDNLFDKIYANRKPILIYFLIATVCSVLRHMLAFFFSAITTGGGNELLAFTVWSLPFFVLCKYFVFRHRAEHIYALLRQIIIYIICIAVLWVASGYLKSIMYAITRDAIMTLSLAGVATELLCIFLMFRIVFKNKK